MDIDFGTLTLQMINFIVLVWVVQRLVYRPVLAVIDQRRMEVDHVRSQAESVQAQAERLRTEYDERLQRWEEEKRFLLEQFKAELAEERQRALLSLQEELQKERQREGVLHEREKQEQTRQNQEAALNLAGTFVSRLCERLASVELTGGLLKIVIEDLSHFAQTKHEGLDALTGLRDVEVNVTSAHALSLEQQTALLGALQQAGITLGGSHFDEDKRLLAGLRIHMGSYVLQANLNDELRFFFGADIDGASHA